MHSEATRRLSGGASQRSMIDSTAPDLEAVVAAADMECQKAYQVVGTGGYRESSIAIEMSTLSVCFLKEKSGRTFLQMAK